MQSNFTEKFKNFRTLRLQRCNIMYTCHYPIQTPPAWAYEESLRPKQQSWLFWVRTIFLKTCLANDGSMRTQPGKRSVQVVHDTNAFMLNWRMHLFSPWCMKLVTVCETQYSSWGLFTFPCWTLLKNILTERSLEEAVKTIEAVHENEPRLAVPSCSRYGS